jgi:hypothetical protein
VDKLVIHPARAAAGPGAEAACAEGARRSVEETIADARRGLGERR